MAGNKGPLLAPSIARIGTMAIADPNSPTRSDINPSIFQQLTICLATSFRSC
jgi:hypothetical protein